MPSWSATQNTGQYSFNIKWNESPKVDPQKTTNKRMKHKLLSYGPFEEPPRGKWIGYVPTFA